MGEDGVKIGVVDKDVQGYNYFGSPVLCLCSWPVLDPYIGPVRVQLASARPIYFRYLHHLGAKTKRQMALKVLVVCRSSTVQCSCSWLALDPYIFDTCTVQNHAFYPALQASTWLGSLP